MRLSFIDFESRCEVAAVALQDRMLRYVSSPQEHDLAMLAAWRMILLAIQRLRADRQEPGQ